jgi:FMN phosphatase YigB (HAD superfamily)
MDSKQYNFYKPHPEDKYDFSEFKDPELILNAKHYKMWPALKNINNAIKEKRSTSELFILTGRSLHVKSAIYEYLKQHGIDIDMEHIITIGDDAGKIDISVEKHKILSKLVQKYDKVVFFDDDPKNIALAAGIQGIKTRLVEEEINENDYAELSLNDLIKLKKQYQKIMSELKMAPKKLKRDVFGKEVKMNSRAFKDIKKEYERLTAMIAKQYFSKFNTHKLVREDMGGVSAPMSTPMNTPGMGNAVPPQPGKVGSGDRWDNKINKKPATQKPAPKRKKKKLEEENINPYDKLGMAMAKKMGVKPPFKKKKSKGNQNAMKQQKFEHQIITLDEFVKKINENK